MQPNTELPRKSREETLAMAPEVAIQKVTRKARIRQAVSRRISAASDTGGRTANQQMGRSERENPARSVSELAQHAGIIKNDSRYEAAVNPDQLDPKTSKRGQPKSMRQDETTAWPETSHFGPILSLKVLDYGADHGADRAPSPLGPSKSTTSLPNITKAYTSLELQSFQLSSNLAKVVGPESSFASSMTSTFLEASKSLTSLHASRTPPVIARKPSPAVMAAFNPKDQWLQKPYNIQSKGLFPALSQSSLVPGTEPSFDTPSRTGADLFDEPSSASTFASSSARGHMQLKNETWTDMTAASSRLSFYAQTGGSDYKGSGRRSIGRTEQGAFEEEASMAGSRDAKTKLSAVPNAARKARPSQQRESPDLAETRQMRKLKPGRRRSSNQDTEDKLGNFPLEKDLLEGFLAPETLQAYGLGKDECYRLFRALRVYSLGFQEVVVELLQHLADRKEVILHVWRVFAKLWDTATFTRFESEVLSIANERDWLRGQHSDLKGSLETANNEIRILREAQGKLVTQAIQRAMEGRTVDEILREATQEAEELRGKLAVAESRAFYESKAKVEAQDKVTATIKALVEEKEARAGDQAASQSRISSLEAELARLAQEKDGCLSSLVDVQNRFDAERVELKAAARHAEAELARVWEETRTTRAVAEEAQKRMEAMELKEKDILRAKMLLQGDLLAKREQYEAEKARYAELVQRLAVTEENVRFMAHKIEELRGGLDEARGKLEESVRKVAKKDAQLEERTQALLRTQTEAEEKRRLNEAAVKDIEDKWATARELEVAQRVKKKRYKNKLADAEKELIKWQADIEAADKMYKDGQAALEKVALLQTQVDEAALREMQLRNEIAELKAALLERESALAEAKRLSEALKLSSDEALRQVVLAAMAEKEEYMKKAEDNYAAAVKDIKVLDTRARSLEKQVGSRDEQIKDFQRDIRRNENATKVLVREKELLVTKLNNADGLHAREIQSMEEAFAARTLEMSSRLAETTANLEKAQEELEMLKKQRQSAVEILEREREAVEKWKAESEVKNEKLEGRVRALESALEERQDELKAATQDAIDLEASLSRLLESAEAEKAELGERTTLADQATLQAIEAALLQGQERARDLEIELGIAQRNADFRLRCLQMMLNQLQQSNSGDAVLSGSSDQKTPQTIDIDQDIDGAVCSLLSSVEEEAAQSQPEGSTTAKSSNADGGVERWAETSIVVQISREGLGVLTPDADPVGWEVSKKLQADWRTFVGRLASAEVQNGSLSTEVSNLSKANQNLMVEITSLREQLTANGKSAEKAVNTRFAEALLKKREQRAQDELRTAVARADALESALLDARKLLAEKEEKEKQSQSFGSDAAGRSRTSVRDRGASARGNPNGESWEAERKGLQEQLAGLETELRERKAAEAVLIRRLSGLQKAGAEMGVVSDAALEDRGLRILEAAGREESRSEETSESAQGYLVVLAERITRLLLEKDELVRQRERLVEDKEGLKSVLEGAREEKRNLEVRLGSLKSELEGALRTIDELSKEQESGDEALLRAQGERTALEERLSRVTSELQAAAAKVEILSEKELSLDGMIAGLEEQKRTLEETVASVKRELEVALGRVIMAAEDLGQTLSGLRQEKQALEAQVLAVESELERALKAIQPEAVFEARGEETQAANDIGHRSGPSVSIDRTRAVAELIKVEAEAAKEEVAKMRELLRMEEAQRKAEAEQAEERVMAAQQAVAEAQEELAHVRITEQKKTLVNLWTQTVPKTGGTVITIKYTPRTLRVVISQIYCDKIAADIADDSEPGGQRQDMKEFVYDFFLFKFGLRAFAELHLLSVLKGLEEYSSTSQRLTLFGAFIGHASVAPPLPTEALDFYLLFLSRLFAETDGPDRSEFEEGRSDVTLRAAASVTVSCFGRDAPGSVSGELLERARALGTHAQEPTIDVDVLMGLVMEAWVQEQASSDQRIGDLFRQADENGDGVLSYGEFSTIVRQIDGTVTERAVKSMFREALLDSNSGSRILPASFEKVARAHGLAGNGHVHAKSHVAIAKACKHDDLALLKESWETVAPLIHEQVGTLKKQSSLSSELKDLESQVEGLQAMLRQGNNDQAPQVWQLYRRIILGFQIQNQRVELRNREEKRVQLGASAFQTLFR